MLFVPRCDLNGRFLILSLFCTKGQTPKSTFRPLPLCHTGNWKLGLLFCLVIPYHYRCHCQFPHCRPRHRPRRLHRVRCRRRCRCHYSFGATVFAKVVFVVTTASPQLFSLRSSSSSLRSCKRQHIVCRTKLDGNSVSSCWRREFVS